MPALKSLVGQRFGKLLVLSRAANRKPGRPVWLCRCDCGAVTDVCAGNLRRGLTRSCGCLIGSGHITHGRSHSRTHEIWKSMRQRCLSPASNGWHRYGGRGITVCQRWQKFEAFLDDMGEAPPGLSLDRIDNDGPYSPENCRWATVVQQARNKRNNSGYEHNGVHRLWAEWAEESAVSAQLLRSRVVVWKWDFERALRTPPTRRSRTAPL